jgi:8-oxo-dGTP pyrophosphatase MutT (NUDIX family)
VDAGETAEEAAVRELKEETGYIGVVSETSPVMFNGTAHHAPILRERVRLTGN